MSFTVYLATRTSKTPHLDPACGFLRRCDEPVRAEAVERGGGVVEWLTTAPPARVRWAKLCSYCLRRQERLIGVQMSVDPAVVPEQPIIIRRRRR